MWCDLLDELGNELCCRSAVTEDHDVFVLELYGVIPAGTVEYFALEFFGPFDLRYIRSVQCADGTNDDWRCAHETLAGQVVFECANPKLPVRVPTKGLARGIEATVGQNVVLFRN